MALGIIDTDEPDQRSEGVASLTDASVLTQSSKSVISGITCDRSMTQARLNPITL